MAVSPATVTMLLWTAGPARPAAPGCIADSKRVMRPVEHQGGHVVHDAVLRAPAHHITLELGAGAAEPLHRDGIVAEPNDEAAALGRLGGGPAGCGGNGSTGAMSANTGRRMEPPGMRVGRAGLQYG